MERKARASTAGRVCAVALATAMLIVVPASHAAPAAPQKVAAKPVPTSPAGRVSGGDETPVPGAPRRGDDLVLEGGAAGTVFRTLTIEGEDRIQIEIRRPLLALDLDPAAAPGLDLGGADDVLNRTRPDLERALLDAVAASPSNRTARPWLDAFATGPVARFRPELTDVEQWSLTVTDARGRTSARFEGRGKPPKEIEWDGRGSEGVAALPGLTYSYVLEARDRAGNRRHFVGDGFQVPAFRVSGDETVMLTFAGDALGVADRGTGSSGDPLLAETATWINQVPAGAPVEILATARSHARADALARAVHAGLEPRLVGDPARVRERLSVEADAPAAGVVRVQAGR
jgi:hypothetical protein